MAYTKEVKREVIAKVKEGQEQRAVAAEHNVHPTTVSRWVRSYRKRKPDALTANAAMSAKPTKRNDVIRSIVSMAGVDDRTKLALVGLVAEL